MYAQRNHRNRRVCILVITHNCNLNCAYCYETHKSSKRMSFELAQNIIRQEVSLVNNSKDYEELEIDFMGGEPLMRFDFIRKIVEWLEVTDISIKWFCFATTNGTLLDNEMKEWFKLHAKSISLGLSYDGTTQMQIKNRGTKSYNIDLCFFANTWPLQEFQITISKKTLSTLAKGILELQRKGYLVNMALAQGESFDNEDALIYHEQLTILKDAYLSDCSVTPISCFTRPIDINNVPPEIQTLTCGCGKNIISYDFDGHAYGCHMFTKLVLGDKAITIDKINWQDSYGFTDKYCSNCILKTFCRTCPGANLKYRGNLSFRDQGFCSMMLAEAVTICEFQIENLALLKTLNEQELHYGYLALKAYKILEKIDIHNNIAPFKVSNV